MANQIKIESPAVAEAARVMERWADSDAPLSKLLTLYNYEMRVVRRGRKRFCTLLIEFPEIDTTATGATTGGPMPVGSG